MYVVYSSIYYPSLVPRLSPRLNPNPNSPSFSIFRRGKGRAWEYYPVSYSLILACQRFSLVPRLSPRPTKNRKRGRVRVRVRGRGENLGTRLPKIIVTLMLAEQHWWDNLCLTFHPVQKHLTDATTTCNSHEQLRAILKAQADVCGSHIPKMYLSLEASLLNLTHYTYVQLKGQEVKWTNPKSNTGNCMNCTKMQ